MTVDTETGTLHVEVRGPDDGPVLVLLHGFPFHGRMWAPQLAALSDRWRLVVPDLRGHGESDVGDGQYAIDFFADDLFAVLDALDAGPVVAAGLSMGGYVLLRAWEREPARFRALVLADTRSAADTDEGRLKRVDAMRALRRDGAGAYADSFAPLVLGRTTLAERPDLVEAVKGMVRSNPVAGMVGAQLAMAARTDTTAALEGIDVPVLVVVGDQDTLTPREVAGAMAERIPAARLAVIHRAGHLSNLENPDAFNRVLRDFLDGLEPPLLASGPG